MQVTILGKRWDLEFCRKIDAADSLGACDPPHELKKGIYIKEGLDQKTELDVCLHELMHAGAFTVLDEQYVDQWATDAARVLWKLGWRKQAS